MPRHAFQMSEHPCVRQSITANRGMGASHLIAVCEQVRCVDLQEIKSELARPELVHMGQQRPLQRTCSESSLRRVSNSSRRGSGDCLRRTSLGLIRPIRPGRPTGPRPEWDCSAGESREIPPWSRRASRCCMRTLACLLRQPSFDVE